MTCLQHTNTAGWFSALLDVSVPRKQARRLGGERTEEGGLEGVADVGLDSAGADEGANLLPLRESRVDDDDRESEDNRKERQCLSHEGSGKHRAKAVS